MPYSASYLEFVMEQLEMVTCCLQARPMFGGVGIYREGIFFALIAEDVLYFFTDESNRSDYDSREMGSFSRNYREVPVEILEDEEKLALWLKKSVAAAENKPKTPKKPARG